MNNAPINQTNQCGTPNPADSKRRGKRKRISQISRIALRAIPEQFAECGNVQRVADDWGIYPFEVRDVVLAHNTRKLFQMEQAMHADRRVVSIERGRAA